jgi:hypothetical protein
MHTKLLRELLHDMANAVAGAQGSLENVQLCDIEPGPSRDSYITALVSCKKLMTIINAAREELHSTYRRNYATYKGEPMLVDKNGTEIHLKSKVEVPDPVGDDLWNNNFVGIVISTTRGEGIVTIRDSADDCWDVDANRVELL